MKITIAGSGAMGCRFGGALFSAGHEVVSLMDGEALEENSQSPASNQHEQTSILDAQTRSPAVPEVLRGTGAESQTGALDLRESISAVAPLSWGATKLVPPHPVSSGSPVNPVKYSS